MNANLLLLGACVLLFCVATSISIGLVMARRGATHRTLALATLAVIAGLQIVVLVSIFYRTAHDEIGWLSVFLIPRGIGLHLMLIVGLISMVWGAIGKQWPKGERRRRPRLHRRDEVRDYLASIRATREPESRSHEDRVDRNREPVP